MRAMMLCLTLAMGCAPDVLDTDEPADDVTRVDVEGSWGPDVPGKGRVRAVHLRADLETVDLAFNDTGVLVAEDVPFGGVTPFLPTPADTVSMQAWVGHAVVAGSDGLEVGAGFGQVGVYGSSADPRSLTVLVDPTPADGAVKARVIHTTPDLPYAGLIDLAAGPLAGVREDEVSEAFTFPPDSNRTWALDLNADGTPDLLYNSFSLPETDSLGNGQVVDVFLVPSGQTLPEPAPPLPVPVLLLVPLDAPDGIVLVTPDLG